MFFKEKMLGIDIGSASIKIVELSGRGAGKTLENYGEMQSVDIAGGPLFSKQTGNEFLPASSVSAAIRKILKEAGITTKKAVFALPDFVTFATSFDIPPMPEKEIPGAITFHAPQYITLPISEVTLDWRVVPASSSANSPLKVFLVAVPNQVVESYKTIAKMSGLDLYGLEAEIFSVIGALIKDTQKTSCVIDLGYQSSTATIIDKGFLKKSYSFNFGAMAESPAAEQSFIEELKAVFEEFFQSEKRQVEEVYLSGGLSKKAELKKSLEAGLGKKLIPANCFANLSYPSALAEVLEDIGPVFSVATGAALDGLVL